MSLAAPGRVLSSEQSERLVAQGEQAYQDGRYEDAETLFQRAVDADGQDPVAIYATGLALGKLGRWRPAAAAFERALALDPGFADAQRGLDLARARAAERPEALAVPPPTLEDETSVGTTVRAPRRWSLYARTGWEFDSNPQILPGGDVIPGVSREPAAAFLAAAGGRIDVLDTARSLLRLEYDFYEALYVDQSEANFQSHRVRATGSWAFQPWLWGGVQSGYTYAFYGGHSYLSEPFVMPFVSALQSTWGLSQLYYRFAESYYLSTPFRNVQRRNGPTNAVGLSQTLYDGPRSLTFGWEYGAEVPDSSAGADYDQRSNSVYVGAGVQLPWRVTVDGMYLFRYENYTNPNSLSPSGFRRHDAVNYVSLAIGRPITDYLSVTLAYYGTFDHSNLPAYEYTRNIVAGTLDFAF